MTSKSPDHVSIKVVPATAERWVDIEKFFTGNPCWCQYWRMSASTYGRSTKAQLPKPIAERSNALLSQLKRLTPPGVLAYQDGQVIGWCGFGPRPEMERLVRSRTIPVVGDIPVWSIVCFFVRSGYRRQGVARSLLQGAIECARAHGAQALEAYPVDPGNRRIDVTFAYVGTLAMFEQEGFDRVFETSARSAGLPRWLMRLNLESL